MIKNISRQKNNDRKYTAKIQNFNGLCQEGGEISYLYTAMGTKLQKTVDYGSYQVKTDYLAGYQYETKPANHGGRGYAELLFYPTPEGYVKALYKDLNRPLAYQYVYNYTDHLGNIRLSYTWDARNHQVKTLQENHNYPFGLRHHTYAL